MGICPYCTGQQAPDVSACPLCGRRLHPVEVPIIRRWKTISPRRSVPFMIVCAIVWGLESMFGSARFISETVPQVKIDALYTRDGGEKIQQW